MRILNSLFSPKDWNPGISMKGENNKYDFSWILERVSKWPKELRTPENVKMIPSGIFWWTDLDGRILQTHLGEPINDLAEYWRLREEWIDKNIKGL